MLKVRYFEVQVPVRIAELANRFLSLSRRTVLGVSVQGVAPDEVVLRVSVARAVNTVDVLPDGQEVTRAVQTFDRRSLRVFAKKARTYVAVIDPPRSPAMLNELFAAALEGKSYQLRGLDLTKALIDAHVATFDAARLVSAKVRDFTVYEGAIGRLEVTSRAGLRHDIAPFLEGAHYKVDSLAYEVTLGFTQGLVYYGANGTVRASGPLVDAVFPSFEHSLPG